LFFVIDLVKHQRIQRYVSEEASISTQKGERTCITRINFMYNIVDPFKGESSQEYCYLQHKAMRCHYATYLTNIQSFGGSRETPITNEQ